jgi:hypothetical protein
MANIRSVGGQFHIQRIMTVRQPFPFRTPFIDRIKLLFRALINGNIVVLHGTQSYEVEILPSAASGGSQQRPLTKVYAIKPKATVAPLRVSGKAARLWSVNQKSALDVAHTHSNLG